MDFLSKFEYPSTVIPGAVVTFRRVTATSRAAFLASLAKYRQQIREIERQRKPLDDEYRAALDKAKAEAKPEVDRIIEAESIDRVEAEKRVPLKVEFPDEKFIEWAALRDEQERIERDALGLSTLRAAFLSIEGVTVDNHPPTLDELIESAPADFIDDLVTAANGIAGLSATERGESPWPGTSPQAEAGPTTNTGAIPAEPAPVAA